MFSTRVALSLLEQNATTVIEVEEGIGLRRRSSRRSRRSHLLHVLVYPKKNDIARPTIRSLYVLHPSRFVKKKKKTG